MADKSEAAAELRLARVKALSDHDRLSLVIYLIARYPETFPDMLEDALSTLSPGSAGTTGTD
ncbi:MAG TPA: hypothetical protein VIJ82_17790 [Streptosporangiaceae bacterium]|jgi:hypothetical protein